MKYKKIILFLSILVLLAGLVSASEVSDDTNSIDDTQEQIVQDTHAVLQTNAVKDKINIKHNIQTDENLKDNIKESSTKTITKDETNKDIKQDPETVTSYADLMYTIEDLETSTEIKLRPGTYESTGVITLENPNIQVTIDGNGQTIDGQKQQVFLVSEDCTLILKNITITNASAEEGGAIANKGILNITGSNFTNNTADSYGGAIENYGNLTITGSNFTNNTADSYGGAIENGGNLTITDSYFDHNVVNEFTGGAIDNWDGNLTLNNVTLERNNAKEGGAIYNYYSNLNMTHVTLRNNTADTGGALYNTIRDNGGIIETPGIMGDNADDTYKYNVSIVKCNFTDNNATVAGAIYNVGNITIKNTNLINNTANKAGGAIANDLDSGYGPQLSLSNTIKAALSEDGMEDTYSNITIINSTLKNNGAKFGGAIFNHVMPYMYGDWTKSIKTASDDPIFPKDYVIIDLKDSTLGDNSAEYGGAIFNEGGIVNINNTTLENNEALTGGAIVNMLEPIYGMIQEESMFPFIFEVMDNCANITIDNSTLKNNSALNVGAVFNSQGIIIINNTTLENNNASNIGAIGNLNGNLTITHSTINNNTATDEAGAISSIVIKPEIEFVFEKNMKTAPIGSTDTIEITSNVIISDTTIKYNTAKNGGAIVNSNASNLNITNSTIEFNHADITGGAIINENGTININTTVFTNNTAPNASAINNTGNATIHNNTFKTNKADMKGKAIINEATAVIKDNINDETSTYYGTIYTKGEDVSIIKNIFDDGIVNTTITISTNNTNPYVGDKVKISFLLEENQTRTPVPSQTLKITVDGKTYTRTSNANGIATVEYTLNSTLTKVTAKFEGNGIYNVSDQTLNINAKKINTKLTLKVSNSTPINNTSINITATLTDVNGKKLSGHNVTLNINGKNVTAKTDANGIITQVYTPTKVEKQTITAAYAGNNQYINSSAKITITVKKINTKLAVKVSNSTPVNNTAITITATLTDADNKAVPNQNVTLTVAGKTFTVKTNTNGVATQSYTPTKVETQTITATYKGDSQHNNSTATANITVKKLNTKLAVKASNTSPVLNTSINITATLTDASGNKLANQNVTLSVAGKTFNVKTNSNGVATQSYTPTKVETQTITATYKGDSQYNNSTATANITVKKINTKIDLKVSNSTPVNNTTITITATLTDTNNNKLANQPITLNVNGKTYNVTTNKDGVATINYTPTKVETQTITATFKGNGQNNNSTATTKITVQNKYNTKTVMTAASGVIGEKLTIKATVTDTNNNKVNEGNLIFKINGVTIKDNGKLSGSNNPLKVKVTYGVATATIIPDVTMKSAETIVASYIGTSIYNASISSPATIKIAPRNASIEITTSKKVVKQGQVLTITARVYDTTNGKKSTNLTAYPDEYVFFKVNGITLKDA
ncbi:MAG: Ig-like domain repeat protein, partial [Methanosphaera sp.]|nr:Ig-like domain repeat protein [Methanosphaera sp.]